MKLTYTCCLCGEEQETGWVTVAFYRYVSGKQWWCNKCAEIIRKWKEIIINR